MRERLQRLRNVVGRNRLMTGALERILEDQPDRRLVIETENRCHRMVWDVRSSSARARGRYSGKTRGSAEAQPAFSCTALTECESPAT